jgi:SAM-dependent methyltransferase
MNLGFSGEVVAYYHKYRRGYPSAAIDMIAEPFQLTRADLALDLGCGTGQLTVPLAGRVRAALGIDPSPDMLSQARLAYAEVPNTSWLLGADTDLPRLTDLLGAGAVAVLTVGQALHWMNHEDLFRDARRILRPGGGIAIVTNGTPLWQQDTPWSRALRGVMEEWWQTTLTATCVTDEQSQQRYARALAEAGYQVAGNRVEYTATLGIDEVIGGVLSAVQEDRLPSPSRRRILASRIRHALGPHEPCRESVRVTILTGCMVLYSGMPERARFLDVFAVREFRGLWLGYLMSVIGDQLALVAVTVLVYDQTHSSLLAALAYAAGFLPWVVGGLTLTRLADAYPRRTVMVTCDTARVFLVTAMALPRMPLWSLVLLLALVTLLDSPFRAARSAMLPDILTGDRYLMGTAAMQITNRIGRTTGFAVGGVVVAVLGAHTSLGVDAGTFAASALLVRFWVRLRPAAAKKSSQDGGKHESVVRRVFTNPRLRTLMLFGWLVPFYAVPEGVAAPYAHALHGGAATTGLILASGPAGAIVGTVAFSRLVEPARRLRYMGPLAVCACAVLCLTPLVPVLAGAMIIFAVSTACSAYQLATNSAFVTAVPVSWRGQAYGLANGGINVGQSAWFGAAGAAALVLSPAVVIAISGLVGAAAATGLAIAWRRLPAPDPVATAVGRT